MPAEQTWQIGLTRHGQATASLRANRGLRDTIHGRFDREIDRSDSRIDRQVTENEEIFIDYLGFFVADLDDAASAIERLGFRPSKQNLQTNLGVDGVTRPAGTSNRLVRRRRGFLEFLAATPDTTLADQLLGALARYSGVHLLGRPARPIIPMQPTPWDARSRFTKVVSVRSDRLRGRRDVCSAHACRRFS
jgi:hypothetical protein